MAKGWKSVSHRDEIIQRLESIYREDRKRPKNQKFNAWFDGLLDEFVEYNEKLKEYGAYLEAQMIEYNYALLMDNLKRKHVFVNICREGKALYCEEDASTDCMHVGFCLALPKVYKVMLDRGFTPPIYEENKYKELRMADELGQLPELKYFDHMKFESSNITMPVLKRLVLKYLSESAKASNKGRIVKDKLDLIYAMAHPGKEIPEKIRDTQEMENTMARWEDDLERLVKNAAAREGELQQLQNIQEKMVEKRREENRV